MCGEQMNEFPFSLCEQLSFREEVARSRSHSWYVEATPGVRWSRRRCPLFHSQLEA